MVIRVIRVIRVIKVIKINFNVLKNNVGKNNF